MKYMLKIRLQNDHLSTKQNLFTTTINALRYKSGSI